jgi:hypothetical protein
LATYLDSSGVYHPLRVLLILLLPSFYILLSYYPLSIHPSPLWVYLSSPQTYHHIIVITSSSSHSSCLPTGLSTSASSVIARPPAVPTAHRPADSPSWIVHRARTSNPHPSLERAPLTLDPQPSTPSIPDRPAVCPPPHRRPHYPLCGVMPPMPRSLAIFKRS